MKVILLAAGKGSRLGFAGPKPLTPIGNGETIIGRLIRQLSALGVATEDFTVTVGHEKERLQEALPGVPTVHCPDYAIQNTAKSLSIALDSIRSADVLWINGDVVVHTDALKQVIGLTQTAMMVNHGPTDAESIKVALNERGEIAQVSKSVNPAEGEAVGVNFVVASDLALLKSCLMECGDQDYFERGVELAIEEGMCVQPLFITYNDCVEVDFPEDLERAMQLVRKWEKE